jgi:hypothetical protein
MAMADDITLTVRVRDLTRGQFDDVRRRMRGMDGDIRRLGQASGQTGERFQRMSRDLQGAAGRLRQLQRDGNLARSEMDFMRRSMGLLSRDLRQAARDGDLTADEFRGLQRELERTRLDFDRLDNEIRRHDAVAQRSARAQRERLREEAAARRRAEREEQGRQRVANAAQRAAQARAREAVAAARRRAREEAAALREAGNIHAAAIRRRQQMDAAAARDERRQQMARANRFVAQQRRISNAHSAAIREEAQRNQRAEAERRRAEAAALAERRRAAAAAAADLQRRTGALAGRGGDDAGLTRRFRGLSDSSTQRMTRGFTRLAGAMDGVSGSTDRARRNVTALNDDLDTMSRVLQGALRDGRLSRREFDALSNGLRDVDRTARNLVRSGDLSRSAFRGMRGEAETLRARLRLLAGEGTRFGRLNDRLFLLQRRMTDAGDGAGRLRRTFGHLGGAGIRGLSQGLRGVGAALAPLNSGFQALRRGLRNGRNGAQILLAVLVLIGPVAQLLGTLLVTVLGGAFLALGAFALRSERTVTDAFNRMKTTVGASVREAAQPLKGALVQGMDQVSAAVLRMRPVLEAAFAATAPLVKDLVGSITDFAAGALPGMTASLQSAGPVIQGFREGMELIGKGIGEMFTAMTAGGGAEGLRQSFNNISGEIREALVDIGEFINAMGRSQTAALLASAIFETLSSILIVLEGAFKLVDNTLGPLLGLLEKTGILGGGLGILAKGMEALGISSVDTASGMKDLEDSFGRGSKSAKQLKVELADIDREIAKFESIRDQGVEFKAGDDPLPGLLQKRKDLLLAIATAEGDAADKTNEHAQSVQSLKDAMRELNADNLSFFDAQTRAGEAVDKMTESFKENGATLDASTEKGQKNRDSVSGVAKAHNDLIESAEKSGTSLEKVSKRTGELREQMIANVMETGRGREAAEAYVNALIGTPESVKTFIDLQKDAALEGMAAVKQAFVDQPGKKTITVDAMNDQALEALRAVGFKVERLPNGKVKVTTFNADALSDIAAVNLAMNNLDGKTANTYTYHHVRTIGLAAAAAGIAALGNPASAQALLGGASGGLADSLPRRGFAGGGATGRVLNGPGTKTSDSLIARLSRGEFVMQAKAVDMYGPDFMRAVNAGILEFPGFAGGGVTKKEKAARKAATGELTVSRFGKMAGFQDPEIRNQLSSDANDSVMDLVKHLNKWRSIIKKTTHGGLERFLLRSLDRAGRALLKQEKSLLKVNKSLEKAKDKLNDLKSSAAQLKESVKSGIVGEANITRAATAEDSRVTINTILSQMTGSSANSKQFASMLGQLRTRGLSSDLISQIGEAGVSGGGMETAAAILGGGKAEIKRINSLQAEIRRFAGQAGKTTADAMFASGIKAADGLVKGLTKNKKKIEAAMERIAIGMERAIKKALKIKSPSQVMEKVGWLTAEGFDVGVKKHGRAALPWESMLTTGPSTATGGGSGRGASSQPIVVNLSIAGRDLGEIVIDPLRRAISHRGGNVQAALGKA